MTFRFTIFAAAAALITSQAAASQCITSKGNWNAYKNTFAATAKAQGVGQNGLNALAGAKLSNITWKFESNPATQTGTLAADPAKFLAKRSGSSAQAFINGVKKKLAGNPKTFAAIENRFGVPGALLASIWGLETSWGGYLGGTRIVEGAVTLNSYCRRYPKFEPHAVAALKMIDAGLISTSTKGGPSGELGHMQFLAGNWLKYGIDGNGDGRADPYNPVDALSSAANLLASNGWQAGAPYNDGTANFAVLRAVWNDSGNYLRAIVYAAERAR